MPNLPLVYLGSRTLDDPRKLPELFPWIPLLALALLRLRLSIVRL